MEFLVGFEPTHAGFADQRVNHFAIETHVGIVWIRTRTSRAKFEECPCGTSSRVKIAEHAKRAANTLQSRMLSITQPSRAT